MIDFLVAEISVQVLPDTRIGCALWEKDPASVAVTQLSRVGSFYQASQVEAWKDLVSHEETRTAALTA